MTSVTEYSPYAYSESLQCNYCSWQVGGHRTLVLKLPKHNCTDFSGAIKTAQSIMPDVQYIYVYCDEKPDILYHSSTGESDLSSWNSIRASKLIGGME